METSVESVEKRSGWGGRRAGAGRRPREAERWIRARGLSPATAAELLERADERRIWYRLLNSQDDSVTLRAIAYLTDRRDGRPAQQINLTHTTMEVTMEDVERARAIVREIRGERLALPAADDSTAAQEGYLCPNNDRDGVSTTATQEVGEENLKHKLVKYA